MDIGIIATNKLGSSNFMKAMLTILWADFIMSLDNVLAVAGAAQGNLYLLMFGLFISVPIVLAGSTLLTKLMDKYSWLSFVGSGILAYTAGEMILKDKFVAQYVHNLPLVEIFLPVALIALVIILGKRARSAHQTAQSQHVLANSTGGK